MKRRRRFIKVIVFLLLGAALNVAVAWGCARFSPPLEYAYFRNLAPSEINRIRACGETMRADEIEILAGAGVRCSSCRIADQKYDADLQAYFAQPGYGTLITQPPVAIFHETGWPLLSMHSLHVLHSSTWLKANAPSPALVISNYGGVLLKPGRLDRFGCRAIDYVPNVSGFAINTLFYAGVMWVLFAAPSALRRMIRRRRGLCAKCAYPIGSSEVCTECGAALR